ncbi:MAG TPA: DUF262 domain-containing protein [Pseudonocardiaceae bacterium]|jgi:hypothetical protein|nr:DUF262 domain-containing protein [Pseudonocardiaceae bacterium]
MADDELDLGENDNSETNDFPPAERQIHTQAYDLSINTLKEQWDDKLLLIPEFQRDYVWDNAKASRLIESLLLNIPIPVLFFAETQDAKYQIVDGHQRVYTVVRYLDNQFPLSGLRIQDEFKGLRFHQLPDREQRFLRTRVMRATIIGADSSPSMKFEVFERLNTGGLALNAQEIRHGLNMGKLSDLLRELEVSTPFRACLGSQRPRKRMVDQELILRFFALQDRLSQYRTPLVRFLNDYMRENRDPDDSWIANKRDLFERTMVVISDILGTSAFRVTDGTGRPTEKVINRAVYEAQSIVFSVCDHKVALRRSDQLRRSLGELFVDGNFDEQIRKSTGDRARTYGRISHVADAFIRADVPIDLGNFGEVISRYTHR